MLERFGSQSNCLAFYKRFLESPNFTSWFERRRQAALLWQVPPRPPPGHAQWGPLQMRPATKSRPPQHTAAPRLCHCHR